ncbi:hypothetical protein [Burkholderia sp. MSHR3999]|uniref:hypothetical protein n=1 Tax=Burkholderia sp. MSHR3999 TaxID=1542965 RepID=UPI0012DFECA7|nr:hypothetical protein [Burkholderia sp. MSHR3999]
MIRDTDLIRYPDSLCPQANHNWPGQLRAGFTLIAIFLSTYQSAARATDARIAVIICSSPTSFPFANSHWTMSPLAAPGSCPVR